LLTLVLAESALETVPRELWSHPAVQKHARGRRKDPRRILLDRSYHHSAMKRLAQAEKRGRPDIIHFALLEALGSPLCREKLLTTYVHTINDYVISVSAKARLPRNCNRFVSLIEQLYEIGRIPPSKNETPLLTLKKQTLPQLVREINPSCLFTLSRIGKPMTVEAVVARLAREEKPAVLVGGFPHGHFSKTTFQLADEVACIDREMLETWTVVSRVIYEFECALSYPKKRLVG